MGNLASMSEVVLQQLSDSVLRPYEQTFVTDGGSNRMASVNWRNKFSEIHGIYYVFIPNFASNSSSEQ